MTARSILIGTSSWTDKTLIKDGHFYPPDAKTKVPEGTWPEWAGPNLKGSRQAAPGGIKAIPAADVTRERKRLEQLRY